MSNPQVIVTLARVGESHRVQECHRYEESETELLTCQDVPLADWEPSIKPTALTFAGDVPDVFARTDLLSNIVEAEFRYTSLEFIDKCLPLLTKVHSLSIVGGELPQNAMPPNPWISVTLDNCVACETTTLLPTSLAIRQPYGSHLPGSIFSACRSLSLFGLFTNTDPGVFQWGFLNPSTLDFFNTSPADRNIWLKNIALKIEDLHIILNSGASLVAIYECALSDKSKMNESEVGLYPAIKNLYISSPFFESYTWVIRACPQLEKLSLRQTSLDEEDFQVLATIESLEYIDLTDSLLSPNIRSSIPQVTFVDLTRHRGISAKRAKRLFPNAEISWNTG